MTSRAFDIPGASRPPGPSARRHARHRAVLDLLRHPVLNDLRFDTVTPTQEIAGHVVFGGLRIVLPRSVSILGASWERARTDQAGDGPGACGKTARSAITGRPHRLGRAVEIHPAQ